MNRHAPIPVTDPMPAPPDHHGEGWPPEVERTAANRWAVARAGTVHGHFGPPVRFERQENGELVAVVRFGTWTVCRPCPGTLADCDEHGCRSRGRCGITGAAP